MIPIANGPGEGPLVLATVAAVAFLVLASMVLTDMTRGVDIWGMLALRDPVDASRPFGPAWLVETGRDFTALGSNGVVVAFVLATSGLLAVARKWRQAAFLLATFWGALLLVAVIKHLISRPRPEIVPHSALVFTSSFPSSHATVSAAVVVALAVLVSRATPKRGFQASVVVVATFLIASVGLSRIYLGLHWPSDVIAGWLLGTAWTAICWHVASRVSGDRSFP